MTVSSQILKSIDHLHEKIDGLKDSSHKIDKSVVNVEGQLKSLNGQVKRNKEDIKSIKAFTYKVTTAIGAVISTTIGFMFKIIK